MRNGKTLLILLAALLALSALPLAAQDAPITVRIGYQRGDYYSILEENGALEAALKEQFGDGLILEYTLFTSGPPLLEALNGGSVDIGWVGNTPPIFAQAAGVPLTYVASQITSAGHAILVSQDSDIQSVEDLVGKQIAFTRGSSANYFVIQSLETVGLSYTDIVPVFLQPADARAAFDGGSVDAWSIWDPFLNAAIAQSNARPIITHTEVELQRSYQIAASSFVEAHPEVVVAILDVVQDAVEWARENPEDHAAVLEAQTGVPAEVWLAIKAVNPVYDLEPIYDDIVVGQQAVADIFYSLELIPEAVDVRSVVWVPEGVDPSTPSLTAPVSVDAEEEAATN